MTGDLTSGFSCLGPNPRSDFFLLSLKHPPPPPNSPHTRTHFPYHADHLISGLNWLNERGSRGSLVLASPPFSDPCLRLKSDTAPVTFPDYGSVLFLALQLFPQA